MAAQKTPQRKDERDNTRSDLFFDNWREGKVSNLVLLAIVCAALGILALGLYLLLTMQDWAKVPFIGSFIVAMDVSILLDLSLHLLMACPPLLIASAWLRRYMPHKYQIERDFIRAFKAAGILPQDIPESCFKYKITVRRFQKRAEIRFVIRYPDRGYAGILKRTKGIQPTFVGNPRLSLEELTGKDAKRYNCCLILDYSDDNE